MVISDHLVLPHSSFVRLFMPGNAPAAWGEQVVDRARICYPVWNVSHTRPTTNTHIASRTASPSRFINDERVERIVCLLPLRAICSPILQRPTLLRFPKSVTDFSRRPWSPLRPQGPFWDQRPIPQSPHRAPIPDCPTQRPPPEMLRSRYPSAACVNIAQITMPVRVAPAN